MRTSRIMCGLFFGLVLASPTALADALGAQHKIPAIRDALTTPIPAEAQQQAREFDDALLQKGQMQGQSFYLVSDARLDRIDSIIGHLLRALGRNPNDWVVRVLETNPPQINAFVAGGRYVYVFTGLINSAQGDDELAFILGHELGHVLLKHNLRQEADTTDTVADFANLIALLSDDYRDEVGAFAKVLRADYSRVDEEEADALGVAIALRAGYDPTKGVAFFSRMRRQRDQADREAEQALAQAEKAALQARANYQQALQTWNQNPSVRTAENEQILNQLYGDAERKRQRYNSMLEQHRKYQSHRQTQAIFQGHPPPQNRAAAVTASIDFLAGRRNLPSMKAYQQTYRVYQALDQIDSPLVGRP